jgi:hypothetical protein
MSSVNTLLLREIFLEFFLELLLTVEHGAGAGKSEYETRPRVVSTNANAEPRGGGPPRRLEDRTP